MGRKGLDRIKRISLKLLEIQKNAFTSDFDKNKEVLATCAVIRSKHVRNKVAGYITSMVVESQQSTASEKEDNIVDQNAELKQ